MSDYIRLSNEYPTLFQEPQSDAYGQELKTFASCAHDTLAYFVDLTMKDDVLSATSYTECHYRSYEEEKLGWLVKQTERAVVTWREERNHIPKESDRNTGDEVECSVVEIQRKAIHILRNCCEIIEREELWKRQENLSQKCSKLLSKMKSLELTPLACNVLKTTDAGPGVGVSKTEVRFRDIEIARIHSSDRVNHIHRAPGDSGQNESEKSNAAIGNALVDGAALKW